MSLGSARGGSPMGQIVSTLSRQLLKQEIIRRFACVLEISLMESTGMRIPQISLFGSADSGR